MANGEAGGMAWTPERRPWGWGDALALVVWTAALTVFFWDAVSQRGALFYFDISEINFPYRDFFARELRAGRFSRWCPELYCGLPLYSESQAGYLHPLKYLLYPWMASWQAFNLDTVLSVWLTGLGAYGWLRRHVGSAGALAGAATFGLSGFVWAHLIHTSMTNALISVPLVFWALESAWDGGRLRGVGLGALALACQVFAGHLQDTILTSLAVGLYGLYRAATERGWRTRLFPLSTVVGMVALAGALAAVQWVPSKELLDRSPRAGGLEYEDITYGSWHPELLPTLLVREAYGTRARDTDWMDGYYPYHEMNAYLGALGLALAVVGLAGYRDRWVGFWPILAGLGGLLMLGKFTVLFDAMPRIPVVGSSRIPVRYHLWVSLAVAALAAVGVDRLARPGRVRLRWAVGVMGGLILISAAILVGTYRPLWTESTVRTALSAGPRPGWLQQEWEVASLRTAGVLLAGWMVATWAARTANPRARRWIAALLPVLIIGDLLGSHRDEAPTVPPSFWTDPPASARALKADPEFVRLYALARLSSGEPGYASGRVDQRRLFAARDTLDWSLPVVWGLRSGRGETPLRSRRSLHLTENVWLHTSVLDLAGITHFVAGFDELTMRRLLLGWSQSGFTEPPRQEGTAYLYRNRRALPRARLMGRPVYVPNEQMANRTFRSLGPLARDSLIVEDPGQPLPTDAVALGRAEIVEDEPERVVVEVDAQTAGYLVLADTYDPGWSATVDGRPSPIYPAQVAFRAVFVAAGRHRVVFRYRPAGFLIGLAGSLAGLVVLILTLVWPRQVAAPGPPHGDSGWPRSWPVWGLVLALGVLLGSIVKLGPEGRPTLQTRWAGSFHPLTWGAEIETIRPPRPWSSR